MEGNNYKPQIPDVMEAIFDAAYLIFDLVAAILFFTFSKGNILFVLYGILTLTLCGGDAFHLVPRIIRAVRGSDEKIKRQLGIGLQVSSVGQDYERCQSCREKRDQRCGCLYII